ncbi:hypothetical protein [Paraburkholderia humisilvae]|uniref:Uncharacterized protein n=1 Tax=Paraburkholderia humisilvae TaxID=627669 RepID=A0A6J5F6E3_9BURK|nr:hypothetical protein [Paraburkholderia humisilvae]CAB3774440.1 hypothetical protein LMG29542_07817 [Paraburkholderia humisilvae]
MPAINSATLTNRTSEQLPAEAYSSGNSLLAIQKQQVESELLQGLQSNSKDGLINSKFKEKPEARDSNTGIPLSRRQNNPMYSVLDDNEIKEAEQKGDKWTEDSVEPQKRSTDRANAKHSFDGHSWKPSRSFQNPQIQKHSKFDDAVSHRKTSNGKQVLNRHHFPTYHVSRQLEKEEREKGTTSVTSSLSSGLERPKNRRIGGIIVMG